MTTLWKYSLFKQAKNLDLTYFYSLYF